MNVSLVQPQWGPQTHRSCRRASPGVDPSRTSNVICLAGRKGRDRTHSRSALFSLGIVD